MRRRANNLFFAFLVAIFLMVVGSACQPSHCYIHFQDLGASGLVPDKEYVFKPFEKSDKKNLNGTFKIDIAVRYNDKCTLETLPLNIEISSFNSDSISNLNLKIPLFDNKEEGSAKGSYGIYEAVVPLTADQNYDEGLTIALASPEKDSNGIIAIGIICDKIENTIVK